MMLRRSRPFLLAIAMVAMSGSALAVDTKDSAAAKSPPASANKAAAPADNKPESAKSTAASPAENKAAADAKAAAASSRDIQVLLDQFKSRREQLLADREQLEKQLKNATEAQKKDIIEQIEKKQKALLDEQRALGRRIRDDMRKLRPNIPPPGRT